MGHRTLIVAAALLAALLAPLGGVRAQGEPQTLRGFFYVPNTRRGGELEITLGRAGESLEGAADFTALPIAASPYCGAGAFTADARRQPIVIAFTSRDEGKGCGADWGAAFTLKAWSDDGLGHLMGDYTIKNAGRSRIAADPGAFEVWAPGHAPAPQRYEGTFRNVTEGLDGLLTITLVEGAKLISGTLDFDGRPGGRALCGAGQFVAPAGEKIAASFRSRDDDPECGLAGRGTFDLDLARSADGAIEGTYRASGQVGTIKLRRAEPPPAPAATAPPVAAGHADAGRSVAATQPAATAAPRARPTVAPQPAAAPRASSGDGSGAFACLAVIAAGLLMGILSVILLGRARRRGVPAVPSPPRPTPPLVQRPPQRPPPVPSGSLPYAGIPELLTPAEREFFGVLRQAVPAHMHVFAQVRLANLVRPTARDEKARTYDFYRIQAKCVDFVVCDATTAPRLVVELDDASHRLPDRQRRDAFVDEALASAGLPILHVPWRPRYDPLQLAADVNAAMDGRPAPAPTPAPLREMRHACGSCGAEVRPDARHCPICGVQLGSRMP